MDSGEPKYLNSPETPIFHKGAELYGFFQAKGDIRQQNIAIAVEGYMDVIALAQFDINIGTTANIVVCFDGDRAGRQAAWRAMENALPLLQDGRNIKFLFLPQGEDPDSMVRKIGKDEFMDLAHNAMPLSEFLIDNLKQDCDLSSLEGRAKLANDCKAYIQKLPNGMLKALLMERVSKITNIQTEALNQNIEAANTSQQPKQRQAQKNTHASQQLSIIRRAISLIIQNPKLARTTGETDSFIENNLPGHKLFAEIVNTITHTSGLNTASLLERFRDNYHFKTLENLATHPHKLTEEEQSTEYTATVEKLRTELDSNRLDALLRKEKETGLDKSEKETLVSLLISTKRT